MLTYSAKMERGASCADAPVDADPGDAAETPIFGLVELLFFAYRDFVGDADRRLEEFGFGRAHHRVLHFVHRQPGLTVNALLDILRITKQSLNRVMKDLSDAGLVEARAGVSDRRQRLLCLTPAGTHLAEDLTRLQSARIRRALGTLPPGASAMAGAFLLRMVDPDDRARVADLVWLDDDRPAWAA